MAKLSANGRELLRVELEKDITDPTENITWCRWTRTYHSNGKILQKYDVRFKPDNYRPQGEFHSFGWKLFARVKQGLDPAQVASSKAARIQAGTAGSWKIVNGGPAPVVLDPERIMRAAQSDEMLGFCQDCGATAHGVEPDARNYKCESCGAMAVYGAEELLIGM